MDAFTTIIIEVIMRGVFISVITTVIGALVVEYVLPRMESNESRTLNKKNLIIVLIGGSLIFFHSNLGLFTVAFKPNYVSQRRRG